MKNRIKLVEECYNEVIKDLAETQYGQEEPTMPNTSEIIRDYKCEAAEEWGDLTVEEADKEFDRLYKIIDEQATLKAQEHI